MHISYLNTPCVIIDDDIVQRNLEKAQNYFNRIGVNLRPHIKTHKIPELAKQQLKLGAVGINCQKISEAIPFAKSGIEDILLTYNIVGAEKIKHLSLLATICDLKVTVDNAFCIDGLAQEFLQYLKPLQVLIECDTGAGRCGVQNPQEALELAKYVQQCKGLEFVGLLTYPAPYTEKQTEAFFQTAKTWIEQSGIQVQMISSGGTPSMYQAHQNSVITEHRAGTYIYCDRSLLAIDDYSLADCALHVLATVVSVPTLERCIIDAGSKALTSDLLNQKDYGYVLEYPDARLTSLSEEHGTMDIAHCAQKPQIGEKVRIIPNHCCVVSNLFDTVYFHKQATVSKSYEVVARGCVF